ncbi:MAG TPA: hypothetical protein VHN14_16925 [Kofleriaceae bacterium]|jgi:hypothetical protein|nr:hypothetical protein [Kofleriaceae bacterium]
MARELVLFALVLTGDACGRDKPVTPTPTGAPLASKAYYRVDAGPATPCASGAACEAHLVLTALGAYHVNKDYPFKFVGDPAPAPPVEDTGTFTLDDATHGTLTIRFRPKSPGPQKLVGVFKLSVCSDDTCEIETPALELTVPVR